jgi:hypothetical protein
LCWAALLALLASTTSTASRSRTSLKEGPAAADAAGGDSRA